MIINFMKPNHKVKFPDFAGYNYKEENRYYRLVFAENKGYRAGYNSGSIIVCTSLTMNELKLFIANRINRNYPGIIKIETRTKEEVEYLTVIGLQKLSWYVKNIIVL